MKKLMFVVLALCMLAPLAYAAPMMIKGTIIDNACADANKADLGNFVKTHPKSCAVMAACSAGGYSIYSDGKLIKFTDASTIKIAEFLKKDASKLTVDITANKVGDTLDLVSIKNSK